MGTMYVALIQNAALLVALTGLYSLLTRLRKNGHAWWRLLSGLLFGGMAVAGMDLSFEYQPGIIYDGRSIIMAMAGLFGGGISSIVAIVVASANRLLLGGPGLWAGLGSIAGSAMVGLAFRRAWRNRPEKVGVLPLIGLGLAAHVVMLASQLLVLPWPTGISVLGRIWLPVIAIFPAATTLTGLLLGTEERRFRAVLDVSSLAARNTALLGAIPDIVMEVGNDKIYRWANREGIAFFGEDVIGRAADSYFVGEQQTYAQVQPLFTGNENAICVESWQRRRDGEQRLLRWCCRVLKDSSGSVTGALSTARDVTEKYLAEEALRTSEERFRAIASNTPDHVLMQDRDLRYVFVVNPQLGLTEADMIGKTDRDFLEPADAEVLTTIKRRVLETGDAHRLEVPLRNANGENEFFDGAYIPRFDANGKVDGLIGYFRNVTERKCAEAERERLTAAIEQAGEAVVISDAEGTIQYVNPTFERVTGYSRQEAIGQSSGFVKSGEQDAAFYQRLWQTIGSGRTWQGTLVNKRKDGKRYTEEATISPVSDADGRIVSYVAVKRDVTGQRHMEEQLRQAQKMETVGQLAGGVAHVFNNQLQVILSYVEMSLDAVGDGQPTQKYLRAARTAAKRSAVLTGQLLAFARQQMVSPRVLDLNDVVANAQTTIRRLLGEGNDLAWVPGHDPWKVKVDPVQLEQVLSALADNARDAMGGGGTLTIETRKVTLDQAYCATHAGSAPGEYVLLAVRDDGQGMDKETLGHLFEPFFTTKGQEKGTGLGLATVYGIVKQNGGHIEAHSTPGAGSTFEVYLPRAE
jgi:PAS domain S-box-containing protein